jgi:hypothetical protein
VTESVIWKSVNPRIQFCATCAAATPKNGATYVLLRFEPDSHLMGQVSKELGELEVGKTYKITIEEEIDA